MEVKVSIIVPVYNVEEYIAECIDSLMHQTLYDIEIILVDDGSTDKSGEICEKYSQKDERITLIRQKNSGQSVARNKGLKESKGEYILFVDSDDYIDLKTCEILYLKSKSNNLDIIHGDLLNNFEKINDNSEFRNINSENKVISGIDYLKESIDNNNYDIIVVLYFIRREYLIKNNLKFIEGCYYEDQEFTLSLLTVENSRFMKIRFPYYFYRINRRGSTTSSASIKKCEDFIKVLIAMNSYIESVKNLEHKVIMYKILSLAYYHMSQVWLKLEKQDRAIVISQLRCQKNLKRNCLKYNYPRKRIILQNYIFTFSPKLLTIIYKFKF